MTIKISKPFTIWIIGPSASGKTTIAKELYNKIQKEVSDLIIIDGGNIRELFDNKYGYDAISRYEKLKSNPESLASTSVDLEESAKAILRYLKLSPEKVSESLIRRKALVGDKMMTLKTIRTDSLTKLIVEDESDADELLKGKQKVLVKFFS